MFRCLPIIMGGKICSADSLFRLLEVSCRRTALCFIIVPNIIIIDKLLSARLNENLPQVHDGDMMWGV